MLNLSAIGLLDAVRHRFLLGSVAAIPGEVTVIADSVLRPLLGGGFA